MTGDIVTPVTPEVAPPAAPEEPKPNPFARLAGVFFNPVATMESIARRPDWLVAMLIVMALSFVTNYLAMPHLDMVTEMTERMSEQGMSEEQIGEATERIEKMQKVMGPVSVALTPVWIALLAGILFLAFKVFGAAGTFKQAFAVTTYAWLPLVLKGILTTLLVMRRSDVQMSELMTIVRSNPAFLVDAKEQPAAFAFLSSIDIFTIFIIFLLVIGFAALARVSRGRAAALIVSLWLIVVLGKTGLASL